MVRTFLCLPLCLLLAPNYPGAIEAVDSRPVPRVQQDDFAKSGLPHPRDNVLGFLEACLKRYQDNVKGYTLSFRKRERIAGKLKAWETIEVCYSEQPHKVFFDWQEGAGLAIKALYAEGENKNAKGKSQILALPKVTLLGVQSSDIDSASSKSSGRYPLSEFGLKQALLRVLEAWKAADSEKALHVDYEGLFTVQDVGPQKCYKLRRHSFARPEGDDGITEAVIYIDCETLFQVGSLVYGEGGEVLGEYYFRNIHLNPDFQPAQFTREALKK